MTSEWWTYRPGDFLMFSARTYYRLIEQYNRDIWPAHLAAIGAGVVILILAVRRAPGSARAIPAIVSILWLWVAWAFHFERYATINLAAKWFAVAFALQGLLLVLAALRRPTLRRHWIGLGLFAFALVIEPILWIAAGRSWTEIELFGLAPDPTAVGTLGIALLLRRPWLLPIPILWCVLSGATLWTMHTRA